MRPRARGASLPDARSKLSRISMNEGGASLRRGWISGRTFRREETTQSENNEKKRQQSRARRVLSLRGRERALRKEAQEGSTAALINIQRDQAQESRFGCGNNWALKASRVLKVPGSSQARTKENEGVFFGRSCFSRERSSGKADSSWPTGSHAGGSGPRWLPGRG